MKFSPQSLGLRLRAARENCELTQQDVADALGLPRPAISQIESGNRSVSTLELAQFAELYRRNVVDFFDDAPVETGDPVVELYRIAPGLEQNTTIRQQVDLCYDICREGRTLERLLEQDQHDGLPHYPLPAMRNTGDAVRQGERIAAQERQRLGLGHAAISDMADLLNDQGIWASGIDLPSDMSGLFLHHSAIGLCILVNFAHVKARKRFSYAHEFCHALVDRDERAVTVSSHSNASELVEKRANAFAAAFLIPPSGVHSVLTQLDKGQSSRRDQFIFDVATDEPIDTQLRPPAGSQKITFKDVTLLAHHFGVSYRAAAYRLNSLGIISRDRCNALLNEEVNGQEMLKHLKIFDDLEAVDQPERRDRELKIHIAQLAIEAYRLEAISRGKFMDLMKLLGLPGRQFFDLAETAKND